MTTGFYLLDHPNKNAALHITPEGTFQAHSHAKRKNGLASIRGIIVHTAEALDKNLSDGDQTAESVAKYLASTDRAASAHQVTDSDSSIPLLPDEAVAFHCKGANTETLGLEIAYRADAWGKDHAREETLIRRAAEACKPWVKKYDIPPILLTAEDWKAGKRGFLSHASLDPSRRTDPGPSFPWARFFECILLDTNSQDAPVDAISHSPMVLAGGVGVSNDFRGIRAIQDALRAAGFDPGPSDGIAGKRTVSALRLAADHYASRP